MSPTRYTVRPKAKPSHNVILFVPDGLRALSVTHKAAPAMAAIRDQGVNFENPHSLFPTLTTTNASAFAAGHYLGDTGSFSDSIYSGVTVAAARGTLVVPLGTNTVLGEIDRHFGGNFLNETTLLEAARDRGFSTASLGKLGPALIFDHTERSGEHTIVIDDSTGTPDGIPLSAELKNALSAAGIPAATPSRGDNRERGNFRTPGTKVANVAQQQYFTEIATRILLPLFKMRNKPFLFVYWSRDPGGSQHYQGDSLNTLIPGINGPTSLAAIRNADDALARLQRAVVDLDLAQTTNIIVAADHGFATVSKKSATSPAARGGYTDVPAGFLPPGFLGIDLAKALDLPLFDPDDGSAPVGANAHTRGHALIGRDPDKPDVLVAANGGSDLIYVPSNDRQLVARVIEALLAQDYTSGIFVDDSLGMFAGTLPLSAINLVGTAVTPRPSIVVNFRSYSTDCDQPLMCTAIVADTDLQHGQGTHGSFSRAETMNFMAAIGPDFKSGFIDKAPVSTVDIGRTIARILGLKMPSTGKLMGRVATEAMPGGRVPRVIAGIQQSPPSANHLRTTLIYQQVGSTRYFDAAGYPGRTVGLGEK